VSDPRVPLLEGRRCRLRALRPADAPSIQRHADDESVWRNLFEGFPRPYTLADAQAWCAKDARSSAVELVWGIDVAGEAIGCIGLRPDAGWLRCNAEVGYWIGRAHWGRGIAGEALGLVTRWAWQAHPELTRLYAPIFAWNAGSQAVARKAGYTLEGRLPRSAIKAGQVIDRVQFAAYRADGSGSPAGPHARAS
jgi:ribosomal-protein-alanine N-acetyltransferase